MASTVYISQLLLYDNDDGTQSLRHQKLMVKANSSDPYVPLVSNLVSRLHTTNYKFENTNLASRHLVMDFEEVQATTILPYGSQSLDSLKQLVQQLISSDGVLTARYRGESYFNGNQSNDNF